MAAPKILAFAGSLRTESFHKKLIKIAARGAREAGGDVTELDLRDLPMPIYDADLQVKEGFPANARKFKELVAGHAGLMIASPEYNWGVSGALKNALDWASRGDGKEPPYAATQGRFAVIMSTSNGIYGGVRGLLQLRAVLTGCRITTLAQQVAVTSAKDSFAEDGSLKSPEITKEVMGLGAALVRLLAKLAA
ncbi:MAG: NAD(P)H-dependent oxidoreductase [Alphaproteobacteria bacterium]|nr:NAD(P)H-dependent oxidoreductase [Alphaproteobacteria bacterium]